MSWLVTDGDLVSIYRVAAMETACCSQKHLKLDKKLFFFLGCFASACSPALDCGREDFSVYPGAVGTGAASVPAC